nr:uncharacterized protein LOC109166992 isoform X2 [Ipomoea batatas]
MDQSFGASLALILITPVSRAILQVGEEEAEKFCKAFQEVYKKLVYEELSLDAARKFLSSTP